MEKNRVSKCGAWKICCLICCVAVDACLQSPALLSRPHSMI